jgi:hypothetical protein
LTSSYSIEQDISMRSAAMNESIDRLTRTSRSSDADRSAHAAILLAQHDHHVGAGALARSYPLPGALSTMRSPASSNGRESVRSQISEPAEAYEWRNATGTTLLRFGQQGDGPSGWPYAPMFNQPALETLLDQRAVQLPTIDIRRGVEINGPRRTRTASRSPQVDAHGSHGTLRRHCDGANSTVRRSPTSASTTSGSSSTGSSSTSSSTNCVSTP